MTMVVIKNENSGLGIIQPKIEWSYLLELIGSFSHTQITRDHTSFAQNVQSVKLFSVICFVLYGKKIIIRLFKMKGTEPLHLYIKYVWSRTSVILSFVKFRD